MKAVLRDSSMAQARQENHPGRCFYQVFLRNEKNNTLTVFVYKSCIFRPQCLFLPYRNQRENVITICHDAAVRLNFTEHEADLIGFFRCCFVIILPEPHGGSGNRRLETHPHR